MTMTEEDRKEILLRYEADMKANRFEASKLLEVPADLLEDAYLTYVRVKSAEQSRYALQLLKRMGLVTTRMYEALGRHDFSLMPDSMKTVDVCEAEIMKVLAGNLRESYIYPTLELCFDRSVSPPRCLVSDRARDAVLSSLTRESRIGRYNYDTGTPGWFTSYMLRDLEGCPALMAEVMRPEHYVGVFRTVTELATKKFDSTPSLREIKVPKDAVPAVARLMADDPVLVKKLGVFFSIGVVTGSAKSLVESAAKKSPSLFVSVAHAFVDEALSYVNKHPEFLPSFSALDAYRLSLVSERFGVSGDLAVCMLQDTLGVLENMDEKEATDDMLMRAVRVSSKALPWLHANRPDWVKPQLCSLHVDRWGLENVPSCLRTRELCVAAVENRCGDVRFVPPELLDAYLLEVAIFSDASSVKYVPADLPDAERLCALAVQHDPYTISHVPPSLRTLRVCRPAMKTRGAVKHVPDSLISHMVGLPTLGERLEISNERTSTSSNLLEYSNERSLPKLLEIALKMKDKRPIMLAAKLFPKEAAALALSEHEVVNYLSPEGMDLLKSQHPELADCHTFL